MQVRYQCLDSIRGITLISMVIFHITWDLVYIFDVDWDWFYTEAVYVWQQSICLTFIALSGICWSLSKHRMHRAIIVLTAGFTVSLVTCIFTPDQRVRFGILTLLGVCMLLMIPLEQVLKKVPATFGVLCSFGCYILTRNINDGYLGFEKWKLLQLPSGLYNKGDLFTFLGFKDNSFYSVDYFSLVPWLFMFVTGYFGYKLMIQYNILEKYACKETTPKFLGFIGRHSLLIYMIHQPIIYLVLYLIFG